MRILFNDDGHLKAVEVTEAIAIGYRRIGVAFRESGTHYDDSRDFYNDYHDIAIITNNTNSYHEEFDSWSDEALRCLVEKGYLICDDVTVDHTSNTDMSILAYAQSRDYT